MDINTFLLLHFIGIATLFMGLGGMIAADAGSPKRKSFAMWQGVGLLIMLLSGFGMLGILKLGFPMYAMVKLAIWLVLAVVPVLARKVIPTSAAVIIAIVLAGIAGWIGMNLQTLPHG